MSISYAVFCLKKKSRKFVEADVDRFQTDLHLAPGATMASIRATAQERRFRRVTGLDVAFPRQRFALSDPAGYLELQESVIFFNDTSTPEIYPLSLHDALPLSRSASPTSLSAAMTPT